MNSKQYKNIIDQTIQQNPDIVNCDSVESVRAVLNNMGIPLPQGDCKKISEILATDDYMFWKSCNPEDVQSIANSGCAVIGVTDSEVFLINAEDPDEETSTESVASFARTASALTATEISETSDVSYYSYSSGTTSSSFQLIDNGVHYINNKQYGKYLRKISSGPSASSGTLSTLSDSIKWQVDMVSSGTYTIRPYSDSTSYLSTDGTQVQLSSISGTIPDKCKWKASVPQCGGVFFKNVSHNVYLACNSSGLTVKTSVGESNTDDYYSCAWRILSTSKYGDTSAFEHKELSSGFSFDFSDFCVGDIITPKVIDNDGVAWADASDFTFTVSSNYVLVDTIKHTMKAYRSGNVSITVRHKVTNRQKTISITIHKTAIIMIPGIMGSKLKTIAAYDSINVGEQLWPPYNKGNDEFDESRLIKHIAALKFDEDGNQVCNTVDIAWDDENAPYDASKNFGALETYKTINKYLFDNFGDRYDVKFFQYDWRLSNTVSATKLNTYIENMGYKRVVLVAHSMGGLVASHYLNLGEYQRKKVQSLVTLGTPFFGSLDILQYFHILRMLEIELYTIALTGTNISLVSDSASQVLPTGLFILYCVIRDIVSVFRTLSLYVAENLGDLLYNIPAAYELFPSQLYFSVANEHYVSYKNPLLGIDNTYTTYSETLAFLNEYIYGFNESLMQRAEVVNNALYSSGNFITYRVNSYYIVGTNVSTLTDIVYKNTSLILDPIEWIKRDEGDGTVPECSANLGNLYPSRVFCAVDRKHTGEIKNDVINEEGLVVSDNVLNKIFDIINGNPNSSIEGIE